jgi:hypothetical protein
MKLEKCVLCPHYRMPVKGKESRQPSYCAGYGKDKYGREQTRQCSWVKPKECAEYRRRIGRPE